jgi:hypothetical protein
LFGKISLAFGNVLICNQNYRSILAASASTSGIHESRKNPSFARGARVPVGTRMHEQNYLLRRNTMKRHGRSPRPNSTFAICFLIFFARPLRERSKSSVTGCPCGIAAQRGVTRRTLREPQGFGHRDIPEPKPQEGLSSNSTVGELCCSYRSDYLRLLSISLAEED